MANYFLIDSTTNIIENIINLDPMTYTPPSGKYVQPFNGQGIGQVYDALFHIGHFVNETTGEYIGDYPYNNFPSGTVEVPVAPDDSRMYWDFENDVFYWAKPALKSILADLVNNKLLTTISVEGLNIATDQITVDLVNTLVIQAQKEIPSEGRVFRQAALTNTEVINIQKAIQQHYQNVADAEIEVCGDIDTLVITDPNDLEAALNSEYDTLATTPIVRDLKPSLTSLLADKVDKDGSKVLSDVNFSTAKDGKLTGIASGATANSSDATLLARANHTGTQAVSTINGFQAAVDARVQLIVGAAPAALDTLVEIAAQLATDESAVSALTTAVAGKVSTSRTVNGHALTSDVTVTKSDVSLGNCDNTSDLLKPVSTATTTELNKKSRAYEGTTLRNNALPIFKNATVGAVTAGVAIFHLTDDGLSTGNALFPNGVIQDSVNPIVSDATASYQMSWAFTNSNKTITVTANKLTTANILTGLLGQAAATSAVVKLSVWGY